ncbi:MAG: hypothetical protein D6690_14760 [Nitrospirae bacterium]|nr:MAG: hypothetical protein D6690_14760 [Nitrospirota bacterium]
MGQVIIRNLDNHIINTLKQRAKFHGRSLEEELRTILTTAVKLPAEERVRMSQTIRAMSPRRSKTDSTKLIRKDRER